MVIVCFVVAIAIAAAVVARVLLLFSNGTVLELQLAKKYLLTALVIFPSNLLTA